MKNNWICQLFISVVVMLFSATIFILIVKLIGFSNFTINDMMVSFVGIIATFVVINNYSQVKDMKDEIDNKIKLIEEKLTQDNNIIDGADDFVKKINKALNDRESIHLANRLLKNIDGTINLVFSGEKESVNAKAIKQ